MTTSTTSPSILFVGHDAFRAGAQIFLLRLVHWLRVHSRVEPHVLLHKGGDLTEEYSREGQVFALQPLARRLPFPARLARSARRHFRPLTGRCHSVESLLPRRLTTQPVRLIYLNSVASLSVGGALRSVWAVPTICHVHELDWSIRTYSEPDDLIKSGDYVDVYIAVSCAVERNLIDHYGIPAQRVRRVYPGIPEFVENDAGVVVPYLDVRAAAERIVALSREEGLRGRLGSRAREKVRGRHDLSIAGRQIEAIIFERLADLALRASPPRRDSP